LVSALAVASPIEPHGECVSDGSTGWAHPKKLAKAFGLDQLFLCGAAGNRTRRKNRAELRKQVNRRRETTRENAKRPADTPKVLMASTLATRRSRGHALYTADSDLRGKLIAGDCKTLDIRVHKRRVGVGVSTAQSNARRHISVRWAREMVGDLIHFTQAARTKRQPGCHGDLGGIARLPLRDELID
jgi:hypothetical protein